MTLTDSNLRYLLAIHHLAQQNTEVSPLALAQVMGVTKPSVTSILTSLMKQGAVVRRRYGKIYITDRGVLYARYYDALVEKILQHFPMAYISHMMSAKIGRARIRFVTNWSILSEAVRFSVRGFFLTALSTTPLM